MTRCLRFELGWELAIRPCVDGWLPVSGGALRRVTMGRFWGVDSLALIAHLRKIIAKNMWI